jgi:hypothetical protein
LDTRPTTEESGGLNWDEQPAEPEKKSGVKLPPKISELRWKLGQKAKQEPKFRLGFTLRYDRDLFGRSRRYLNVFPSAKAMARAHDRVREVTGPKRCFVPIREMIDDINRWAKGWGGYFRHGYPRKCFRDLNRFLQLRSARHLRRRSQRAYRTPAGESSYAHLQRLGLRLL